MSLTIVIVDDQDVARTALTRVVRSAADGAEIIQFSAAAPALEWIREQQPDLVITDFVMPGEFDGMELLRRLKKSATTAKIPVIVVTSQDDEKTRNAALELEAIDYLAKPIDTIQCKFRIRNVLAINQTARELKRAFEDMEALRRISAEHEEAILIQAQIKAATDANAAREAKDLFVAMVSHEFRTPLQSIISTVETLNKRLDQLDVPADDLSGLRTPMRRLQHDAEQLVMQASDLADFVRAESGRITHKPRRIDLSTFLEDVTAQHTEDAQAKGIMLTADAPHTSVQTDLMRLRQIVSNLAGNAVKYTEKGSVRISLDLLAASAEGAPPQLQLTVRDTGIGIPDKLIGKVFEPWIRGDIVNGQKGMGLGLSIVQNIVALMKGTIELKSQVGVGTTVVVKLPVIADESGTMAVAAEPSVRAATQTTSTALPPYKVLLVDDTDSTRDALRDSLQDAGAVVSVASGGVEALSVIKGNEIDVVLLDLQMPEIDGYEVARRVRAMSLARQPLIVAMSAFEIDTHQTDRWKGPAMFNTFVSKPVSLADLVDHIETSLANGKTKFPRGAAPKR